MTILQKEKLRPRKMKQTVQSDPDCKQQKRCHSLVFEGPAANHGGSDEITLGSSGPSSPVINSSFRMEQVRRVCLSQKEVYTGRWRSGREKRVLPVDCQK
jgi:hypothetical protein